MKPQVKEVEDYTNSTSSYDGFDLDSGRVRKLSIVHKNAINLAMSGQPMDSMEARALEKIVLENQKLMYRGWWNFIYYILGHCKS